MACSEYCKREGPLRVMASLMGSKLSTRLMKFTRKAAAAFTVGCSGNSRAARPVVQMCMCMGGCESVQNCHTVPFSELQAVQ